MCFILLLKLSMEIRVKGENSKKSKAQAGITWVSKICSIGPVFKSWKVPSMGPDTHSVKSSCYCSGLAEPPFPHRNSKGAIESEWLVTQGEGAQTETCWSPAPPQATSLQGRMSQETVCLGLTSSACSLPFQPPNGLLPMSSWPHPLRQAGVSMCVVCS